MKKKVLSLLLVAAMGVSMLVGCGGGNNTDTQAGDTGVDPVQNLIDATEGTVELELWCAETPQYQEVMKEVVADFEATYPDVKFNITIGAQSEGQCKDRILEDPEAAADVFVFADDQVGDLVKAGALQEISTTYTYNPAETNDVATVEAAKVDGKMYAYPLTASNGYFLYYDSRYLSAEDVQSWEGLIAAAEEQGLKVGFDAGNAWYLYGFFAGAGCELTYDGTVNHCDWNNETGLAVAESVESIFSSDAFINIGDADAQAMVVNADNKLVAYVDGTWAASAFETGYADGYTATKLPTFKVNGEDKQMGSFAGYKFVGVNAYSEQTGWAMLLAEFITSEASQAKIGAAVTEMPANLEAAKADVFKQNVALVGLAEQYPFSRQQGVLGGNFWTPAGALGKILAEGTSTDLQADLDTAVEGITQ